MYIIWNRRELPVRAPPLLWEMVFAMAGLAMRGRQVEMVMLLIIGFRAFLRTTELLQLLAGDIVTNLKKGVIIINLGFSKSGKRRGERESVVIDNHHLGVVLHPYLDAMLPGDRLWNGSVRDCAVRQSQVLCLWAE